jgi:hypothetical protein
MIYGFTGARKVAYHKVLFVQSTLAEIAERSSSWLVGDANGVDALVRAVGEYYDIPTELFKVSGSERWQFADRSMRLVDELDRRNAVLYAFPDKPCPSECSPSRNCIGGGSGTWLTIAYATWRGVEVRIVPLDSAIAMPYWVFSSQLKLF